MQNPQIFHGKSRTAGRRYLGLMWSTRAGRYRFVRFHVSPLAFGRFETAEAPDELPELWGHEYIMLCLGFYWITLCWDRIQQPAL
jgi:hypothetical protein